jgi:phage-related minor tail protein
MRPPFSNANAGTDTSGISDASDSVQSLRVEIEDARVSSLKLGATLSSALDGVVNKGKSASSIIDTLALSLSKAALNAAFKPLEGALSGAIGGAFSGGFSGGFTPFASGGVISSPVAFPLGGGQTGLAGEAGPEAIMPLTRGADGKLGVATNSGSGTAMHVTFNVTSPDAQSFARSETQIAALLARTVAQGQRNL